MVLGSELVAYISPDGWPGKKDPLQVYRNPRGWLLVAISYLAAFRSSLTAPHCPYKDTYEPPIARNPRLQATPSPRPGVIAGILFPLLDNYRLDFFETMFEVSLVFLTLACGGGVPTSPLVFSSPPTRVDILHVTLHLKGLPTLRSSGRLRLIFGQVTSGNPTPPYR